MKAKLMNFGALSEVDAFKLAFSPTRNILHVIGKVTAPTPCHDIEVFIENGTDERSATLNMLIVATPRPGTCLQVVTAIPFKYVDESYSGAHEIVHLRTKHGGTWDAKIKIVTQDLPTTGDP